MSNLIGSCRPLIVYFLSKIKNRTPFNGYFDLNSFISLVTSCLSIEVVFKITVVSRQADFACATYTEYLPPLISSSKYALNTVSITLGCSSDPPSFQTFKLICNISAIAEMGVLWHSHFNEVLYHGSISCGPTVNCSCSFYPLLYQFVSLITPEGPPTNVNFNIVKYWGEYCTLNPSLNTFFTGKHHKQIVTVPKYFSPVKHHCQIMSEMILVTILPLAVIVVLHWWMALAFAG